jgi:hypothetical protein
MIPSFNILKEFQDTHHIGFKIYFYFCDQVKQSIE